MIKVILADDHNIVRNGIKNILSQDKNIEVVGEALNGEEVLKILETGTQADIILADLNMPKIGAIELAEKLKELSVKIKIVVLTVHDQHQHVIRAFRVGVAAYLFKNITSDELVFAVNCVNEGRRYVCIELANRLLEQAMDSSAAPAAIKVDFSERELMILKLIADGLTNKEIADKLFTSKRTVEGHRQAMINKAGVPNTPALIRFAILNNVIS